MQQKEWKNAFCDSMDGTREYYAKWNKPGSERQIPYDLTYKRNLMNKIEPQAWNMEQTDVTRETGGGE